MYAIQGAEDPNGSHPTGHQAILIGNDIDGWYYYSFDGTIGENGNDGKTNGKYFKTLNDFSNSEYNTYKDNYDDGKKEATSHRGKDGKVIPRYTQGYRIKTDKATDEKMKNEVGSYLTTHTYMIGINDCTDLPRVALDAAGLKNGEYTTEKIIECNPSGTKCHESTLTTPNFLPAAKQKEIENSNKGTDIDTSLKRTTTAGDIDITPKPVKIPDNVKYQKDNTKVNLNPTAPTR